MAPRLCPPNAGNSSPPVIMAHRASGQDLGEDAGTGGGLNMELSVFMSVMSTS